MPSIEVELTRDSVLKQVGPCFSEIDVRAFVERGIQFFYREKQRFFYAVALCVAPVFRFLFSPYGAKRRLNARQLPMHFQGLDYRTNPQMRLCGMCQV